ncbi:TetR/AcrR family transcriptional regulator C-terminal domain-containing protein [Streptomyces sp. NPDC048604]|uniref:TetR/AcrR family transcriptional regulator C-terminal domain-containing protein n=1 Tax=Streptomyces sp. NPDC048604 TaxID=3365578 RepID=UPI00371BEA52
MPRDNLTREQIIRTAIELLDEEGLEGLNMRALGQRLDSAATAVYWHVKNKDNLVTLAGDEVWNEIRLPDLDVVGWRAAAFSMAADLYGMFYRHPWLVQAFAGHFFFGVGKSRLDDHTLAVYEKAGFTGPEADRAAASVFTYVLGNALGAAATASLTRRIEKGGGDAEEAFAATMKAAAETASRFPRLAARIGSTEYAEGPEESFEFGLNAVLDGLEARLNPA